MNEIPRSHHGQINEQFSQTTSSNQPDNLPRYVSPQVISYSNEEILGYLGPIQAGGSPVTGLNFGLPDGGMPGAP